MLRRGPLAHRQLVSLGAAERSPPRVACTRSEAKGRSVSGGRRREAILFREEFGPPFVRTLSWPLNLWGAEGENRRAQPLLADRVGLKPRTTEGHERAIGLVAAFVRARDEKGLREWSWHIAATPAPKCEIRFTLRLEGAVFALTARSRGGQRRPWRRFWPLPGYGAPAPLKLAPSSAWPGPCRVFSLLKTRRPPCASPVGRGSPWQRSRGRPFLC